MATSKEYIDLGREFLKDLESGGMREVEIAEKYGITTNEVRLLRVRSKVGRRISLTDQLRLNAERNHWSNTELANSFGLTESEVRILLKGE